MRTIVAKLICLVADKFSLWGTIGYFHSAKVKKPHLRTVRTSDLYEAAYYLMRKAVIKEVKVTNHRVKRQIRRGWTIWLERVPFDAYTNWKANLVTVPARHYATEREKLKKFLKKNHPLYPHLHLQQ